MFHCQLGKWPLLAKDKFNFGSRYVYISEVRGGANNLREKLVILS